MAAYQVGFPIATAQFYALSRISFVHKHLEIVSRATSFDATLSKEARFPASPRVYEACLYGAASSSEAVARGAHGSRHARRRPSRWVITAVRAPRCTHPDAPSGLPPARPLPVAWQRGHNAETLLAGQSIGGREAPGERGASGCGSRSLWSSENMPLRGVDRSQISFSVGLSSGRC